MNINGIELIFRRNASNCGCCGYQLLGLLFLILFSFVLPMTDLKEELFKKSCQQTLTY